MYLWCPIWHNGAVTLFSIGHNVEETVESREYAVLLTPIAPKCSEASLLTLSELLRAEPVRSVRPSPSPEKRKETLSG